MKRTAPRLVAASLSLASAIAGAQSVLVEPVGVLEDPCGALAPAPAEVQAFLASVAAARARQQPYAMPSAEILAQHADWQKRRLLQDFSGICRYRDDNARLGPATDHRVVFFGDSITELWSAADLKLFADDAVNRGISGQTTAQMMGRFPHDVIALRPRIVHILAGTNDIAGNTGPTSLAWIEANIRSMVELAKGHGIVVVLAAVLPATRFNWRPSIQPAGQIKALNARLREYAKSQGLVFVDYGPALDDGRGGLKPEFSGDGVHPNSAGYARMRPLAEEAIRRALQRP